MLTKHQRVSQKISLLNQKRIIKYIIEKKTTTRAEICRNLHISFPAVSNIVSKLVEQGMIIQKGKQSSSLGRKPISLTLNDKTATIAVAHIGYGELKISILDLCESVLNTSHLRFARKSSFYTVIKMLRQHLSEMLEEFRSTHGRTLGLAVAVPSPLDYVNNRLVKSRFYGWENKTLPKTFNILGKRVPIIWENDSNMLALGASRMFGSIKNLLAIYLGIGIGAGIIYDGKLYRGHNGMAGEIGQVLVPFGDKLKELERIVSEESLIAVAREHFDSIPDISGEKLLNLLEKSASEKEIIVKLDTISQTVSQFLAVLIAGICPELVVFDGEVVRKCPTLTDMILTKAQTYARRDQSSFRIATAGKSLLLTGGYWLVVKNEFGLDDVQDLG